MLSHDLENLSRMMDELAHKHGGLTLSLVDVIGATIMTHAERARLMEKLPLAPAVKVHEYGGNVVPLFGGRACAR